MYYLVKIPGEKNELENLKNGELNMSVVSTVTISRSDKIKWLITVAVTLIIFLIPVGEVYTKQMSLFFTVTIFGLFLMAFEFFEPIVCAIIMPMAWVATGVCNPQLAMSGFTNTIVPMVAGAYFMANALVESGLLKRLALIVIGKCGGSWIGLLFGIFLAGVIISIATFGLSYIIVATLCIGIVKSLGFEYKSKESAMICFACMLGVCSSRTFIYAPSTYAMVIQQGKIIDPAFDITAVQAFTNNIPMFLISCVMLVLINKIWGTAPKLQNKEYFKKKLADCGKMRSREKKAAIYLLIFFALLLSGPLTGIDANLLFALTPWLLLLPGINVATVKSIHELNWQNLFFIASCMAIGTVAASLGIGTIIANWAAPMMATFGTVGFFLTIFGITFVLNFFMTPLAIWSLITAPLCEVAMGLGINILPVTFSLVMCSEAVLLPYEYVPYLIVFSFGMISMGDFFKINAIRCVLFMIGFVCLQLPFWMLIGIL